MSLNATQNGEPRVRPAAPADFAAVERLLTASGLPLDGVHEALSGFVVAEVGDDVVGVAGLEVCCNNGLLRSVAVSPAWRSHGRWRNRDGRPSSPKRSPASGRA